MLWKSAATCSRAASSPRAWSSSENTGCPAYATTSLAVLANGRLGVANGVGPVTAQAHSGAKALEVALHPAGIESVGVQRVLADGLANPVGTGVVGHECHRQVATEAVLQRPEVTDAEAHAERRVRRHLLLGEPEPLLLGEPVEGDGLDLHQAPGTPGADGV